MNKDPFHLNDGAVDAPNSQDETQENIYHFYYEKNITDGGEFLDDALRMKDQPLMETDFNILKPEN